MVRFNHSKCPQCLRIFVREYLDQVFCEFMCKARFTKMELPGTPILEMECKQCGRVFNNYKPRVYCSDECREEMRRDKLRKWWDKNARNH